MKRNRRSVAWMAAAVGLAWSATVLLAQGRAVRPGDPLPGLTAREFTEFRLGLDDFTEVETSEDGLGPAYNATSCAVCHSVPAIGGTSTVLETRAATTDEDGAFKALDSSGETLMHLFSTPTHGCQPVIPDHATIIAHRAPIPVFGAGLVEAIADDTILRLADPADRDRDGVSGRAAIVTDAGTGNQRVGRFGWKAQHATLIAFAADAYRNEMGITNDIFPAEAAYGINDEAMRRCDPRPDPEDRREPATGKRGIDNFESFMKFLAPIERGATGDREREGERVFEFAGCAACHVPALETGVNANPLFDRKIVRLFSDLLLHDIGTGDGIRQGAAAANEIRTPALWGLRTRRPLMHDGGAATPEDAIRRHAGEAALSRRAYESLAPAHRAALLAFLRSL
ncbi:MAG TPA: di-heme oxidoredictase family protein [Vicinamibacterales bacterium]|nr:di-heme oxidoredictase family protein [Vicinamibacterales bacterium]